MKAVLLALATLAFVAGCLAQGNEINFVFAGMIPANSGSDEARSEHISYSESIAASNWFPAGADGSHPGDRNQFYATIGSDGSSFGECVVVKPGAEGFCRWSVSFNDDDSLNLFVSDATVLSSKVKTGAILGGTGRFAGASGSCISTTSDYAVFHSECDVSW